MSLKIQGLYDVRSYTLMTFAKILAIPITETQKGEILCFQ